MILNLFTTAKDILCKNGKNVEESLEEINSNLADINNLVFLNETIYEINSTEQQISLTDGIWKYKYILLVFAYNKGYTYASHVQVHNQLFRYGYGASWSFAGANNHSCWAQAKCINDNTISVVGGVSGGNYTPHLLRVCGIK